MSPTAAVGYHRLSLFAHKTSEVTMKEICVRIHFAGVDQCGYQEYVEYGQQRTMVMLCIRKSMRGEQGPAAAC